MLVRLARVCMHGVVFHSRASRRPEPNEVRRHPLARGTRVRHGPAPPGGCACGGRGGADRGEEEGEDERGAGEVSAAEATLYGAIIAGVFGIFGTLLGVALGLFGALGADLG
jgi:hypothetical protein